MAEKTVGSVIKQHREERGLTQGQLATYANVTREWLAVVESGKRKKPDPDMLKRVASVLHVPADTLLAAAGYNVTPLPVRERTAEEALREALALMSKEREEAERKAREAEEARRKFFEEEARAVPVPGKIVMVPIIPTAAGAGVGQLAETQLWPYIPAPQELGHDFVAIRVQGSCLAPRLLDDDLAIIDKNAVPKTGDIVVIEYEGETILRIYEGDHLVSTNGHPPLPVNDLVRLEGVVVSINRKP